MFSWSHGSYWISLPNSLPVFDHSFFGTPVIHPPQLLQFFLCQDSDSQQLENRTKIFRSPMKSGVWVSERASERVQRSLGVRRASKWAQRSSGASERTKASSVEKATELAVWVNEWADEWANEGADEWVAHYKHPNFKRFWIILYSCP